VGACNQDHVRAHHALEPMLKAYERLFEGLVGQE